MYRVLYLMFFGMAYVLRFVAAIIWAGIAESVKCLDYELDYLGFLSWQRQTIISSQNRQNCVCGQPSPLFDGYRHSYARVKRIWRVIGHLTAHLQLVPRLRMSGAINPCPLYAFIAWTGKFCFLSLLKLPIQMPNLLFLPLLWSTAAVTMQLQLSLPLLPMFLVLL